VSIPLHVIRADAALACPAPATSRMVATATAIVPVLRMST